MTKNTKHTPEPWTFKSFGNDQRIFDAHGFQVCEIPGPSETDIPNAARIVACVNAFVDCANPEAVTSIINAIRNAATGAIEIDKDYAQQLVNKLGVK